MTVPELHFAGSAVGLGAFVVGAASSTVAFVRASDGREYLTQNFPDRRLAAEALARLRTKLEALIAHLRAAHGDDPRTRLLVANINLESLAEGSNRGRLTSYTTSKSDITMCLRSKETDAIEDDSLLTFVLLHEAAHCATPLSANPHADPHDAAFWENFRFMLASAVEAGVWAKRDFKSNPARFCGVPVTDSPL